MAKRQFAAVSRPWSLVLDLQRDVRVCKVMREFLTPPELLCLGRTCKALQVEAKAEWLREVVPAWDGVCDPNAALERSRLWYRKWKSSAVMTSRRTIAETDQIRIVYPGTDQSMMFVTPVHRQLCPGRYNSAGGPFPGHIHWYSDFPIGQSFVLHVPVWPWDSPENKHLEEPRCADFVDNFLDDLAVSMCDFALRASPPLIPWTKQLLQGQEEAVRFARAHEMIHRPLPSCFVANHCEKMVRRGKPVGEPTTAQSAAKKAQRRHAILTAPGTGALPPLFSAKSGERLIGEQGVLRPGDVTADLFTISVTSSNHSFDFRLRWQGSIVFERGPGVAQDQVLEFDSGRCESDDRSDYDEAIYGGA